MSRLMLVALGLSAALVVGACNGRRGGGEDQGTGTIHARLVTDTMDDVASVRIDVAQGGTIVETRTLTPAGLTPPGQTTPKKGVDAFFVLRPGAYVVTATPLAADNTPSKTCASAMASANVTRGNTTEIMLALFCQDNGSGGLDVVVTTEHPPVITNLTLDPSKFTATCAPVTIAVTASDADMQPLTYTWSVTAAPAGAIDLLTPADASATFLADTAGDYTLAVEVKDPDGHVAGLSFPVHVAEGPLHHCVPVVGFTGPKRGALVANANPAKGAGAVIAPLPNPAKVATGDVVVPTPEDVRARFGALAKNVPASVPGARNLGPMRPLPAVSSSEFYGRVNVTITPTGVSANDGLVVNGSGLQTSETLDGSILVVCKLDGAAVFVASAADPRVAVGFPQPTAPGLGHSFVNQGTGSFAWSLPSVFMDPIVIGRFACDFFELDYAVPATTPVNVPNLQTLLLGARPIGGLAPGVIEGLFHPTTPVR